MKHKYEIIAIATSWSSFLVWEYYVHQWVVNETNSIIRMDLILVLPALIMITLWMIFKIKNSTTEK